jgi:hypothetical protein
MNERLAVLINGEVILEYDRNRPISEQQVTYLDHMDDEMSQGITIEDRKLDVPDPLERAQFVCIGLLEAIAADDAPRAAAMCSYLALRLPELKRIFQTQIWIFPYQSVG